MQNNKKDMEELICLSITKAKEKQIPRSSFVIAFIRMVSWTQEIQESSRWRGPFVGDSWLGSCELLELEGKAGGSTLTKDCDCMLALDSHYYE